MIVITAASGKLGQLVANELAAKGLATQTRLAARSPDKLAAYKAKGFEVAAADYEDPASLAAAFQGADTLLLISSMGPNEARIAHHHNAIQAAKAAGIKRIVYTSATNPSDFSRFDWAKAHVATEAELKASGVAYTILRDNSYFSNNDALFSGAKESGVLAFTGIDAKVAYVSHEDVAAATVGALTGAGHDDKTYEISGSSAYSANELAAILAELTGKEIKALDVPLSAFADQFRSMGLPEFVVDGLTGFYAALGAGEYAATSGDVELLTGRPSSTARAYLAKFA